MSSKKYVLVISGTRAEFGLFQSIIDALKKSAKLSPLLILTGMHTLRKFGNTQDEVIKKGHAVSNVIPVSKDADMLLRFREELEGFGKFCRKKKVDCVLVLGDRDEMLAGAIVGTHLGIPIGHIHGGEVTGESVVDSKIRNAITQLTAFHFAATENSATRISKMIGNRDNVFVVGAPGVDLFLKIPKVNRNNVAKRFNLNTNKQWFLVLMHPTPLSQLSPEGQIKPLVEALSNVDGEIIWIYPNSDTGSDIFIQEITNFSKRKKIRLFKNLPREDFVNFLATVDMLVGNSSSGIIESTYLRLPVVNIGDRQKGRERSTNIIDCDYNRQDIENAIEKAFSDEFRKICKKAKHIYGNGGTGKKIVTILEKKL